MADEETKEETKEEETEEEETKEEDKKEEKTTKDPDYLEKELKKAIEKRDEVKKERRKLQEKLKSLEEKIDDAPDPETVKSLKQELKELREFKSDWEKTKEEEELKQKSDLEKAKIRHQKELEAVENDHNEKLNKISEDIKNLQEAMNKKDTYINNLRVRTLKGEIIEAASSGENTAINPNQIFKLTKDDFEYAEDLDKFVHYERDSKGKITDEQDVSEYIKAFLGDPENENLVKSTVNTSSMHSKQTDTTKVKTPAPKFGFESKINPEKEAMDMGLDKDAYNEIKAMQKAKFDKIAENRKNILNK